MSDESDIDDRVASEEDDIPDEYDSEESGSEDANGFLDMEAAESEGQTDDDDDLSSDGAEQIFPQFMQLPPELRARVWELYDPDLRVKTRVFRLIITSSEFEIWESAFLVEQTAPARAMLATHRESREQALRFYPDTFNTRRGVIRYNSEKDVIFLEGGPAAGNELGDIDIVSVLGDPKYLAFGGEFSMAELAISNFQSKNLKGIFLCYQNYQISGEVLQWCVSDSIHHFYTQGTEEVLGESWPVESMYCWPDLENNREFAKDNILPDIRIYDDYDFKDIERWPMIEFSSTRGLERYHKLEDAVATEGEWCDKWSSAAGSEDELESETEDEYESDGIDDATIDGDEGLSEDEDDLIVQSSPEEEISSTFNGFSPPRDDNPEFSLGGVEVGNFSSLEPESPSHGGHDSDHAVSDEEPVQNTGRRKRRIISSDDEDDPEDEQNEEPQASSRPTKRSRVVLSDTEDEDDEGGDEDAKHVQDDAKGKEDDGSSEEEETDVSEEEEEQAPAKAKPLSLFQKLRQFRQENPVSPASSAGSNAEGSMDNEDYDVDTDSLGEAAEENAMLEDDAEVSDLDDNADLW
ncbi:hypothetical protein F4804DRAFT_34171 [Jackrogersella minutella]|nr:hypothetical protein F4804DRAFT_34171 [Jackrogersella minutella]